MGIPLYAGSPQILPHPLPVPPNVVQDNSENKNQKCDRNPIYFHFIPPSPGREV
jgi:hypothetical protein